MSLKKFWTNNYNDVYEEVARAGNYLWVKTTEGSRPFTFHIDNLTAYTPPSVDVMTGDVWASLNREYRVLGVDEENGYYLLVLKSEYDKGNWRTPGGGVVQVDNDIDTSVIYVRSLPEETLQFVRRAP